MYTCIKFTSQHKFKRMKIACLHEATWRFFFTLSMFTCLSAVPRAVSFRFMDDYSNLWTLYHSLGWCHHNKGSIIHISPPIRWLLYRLTFLSHTTRWYMTLLLNFPLKAQGCSPALYIYPLGPWWGLRSCWPRKVHQSNEAGCESMYMGVWDREDGLIELRDGLFPPAGAVKQQVDAIIRAGRWSEVLFTAGLAWPGSICCPV